MKTPHTNHYMTSHQHQLLLMQLNQFLSLETSAHICLLLATAHDHIVEQVLPGNYYWPTLVVTY